MKKTAVMLREAFPEIRFSSVYQTKAMEVETQEDFLNAVARMETKDAPEKVLTSLQRIEVSLRKNPPYRFGPRTIDLDLLLYEDRVMTTPELTIPHPGMQGRRFVLEPLLDFVEGSDVHPVLQKSWKELFRFVQDQQSQKVDVLL